MRKCILVACTNVGRYIAEEILSNVEIKTQLVGIVNLNAKQAITKANYDSYVDIGLKYGVEIVYCNNVNDREILEWISSKSPELIIQSGWSQKFQKELLDIPKYGCIGEHPAPLPKGRGAACVNWAMIKGERYWGDTFFQMVERYDEGYICAQGTFEIEQYDDVFTVYEKVAKTAVEIIRKNIDLWANGQFAFLPQREEATYFKRRKPTDGKIFHFNQEALRLHNFIRAQTYPYPGAYIVYKGKKIKFLSSNTFPFKSKNPCGYVEAVFKDKGSIWITCGNNTILELLRVQEEGKPSCWAKDWAKENDIIGKTLEIDL